MFVLRCSVKNSLLTLYLVVMTTGILITARRPAAHAEENPFFQPEAKDEKSLELKDDKSNLSIYF